MTTPTPIAPESAKVLKELFVLTTESTQFALMVNAAMFRVSILLYSSITGASDIGSAYYAGEFYNQAAMDEVLAAVRSAAQ